MKRQKNKYHWNNVLTAIREHGPRGIAVYDLEDELELKRHDPLLLDTLRILQRQGYITQAIGMSKKGLTCGFVQASPDKD